MVISKGNSQIDIEDFVLKIKYTNKSSDGLNWQAHDKLRYSILVDVKQVEKIQHHKNTEQLTSPFTNIAFSDEDLPDELLAQHTQNALPESSHP